MNRTAAILVTGIAALGLAAGGTTAWAQGKGRDKQEQRGQGAKPKKQHKHKDGKSLVGDKIKQNGRHKIDQNGKYSTFVETHNGKIRSVKVNHADKGDVPVKKYKTNKKMAELTAAGGIMPVNLVLAQSGTQYLGQTWIGYSYYDEYGDEVIYWFPYDMIEDLDTGAIEYIPADY
jgi:hypothetical protein